MAKNDQEEAFEKQTLETLKRVIDFLKYAEAKNGALLTLTSAWLLAIISLLTGDRHIPDAIYAGLYIAAPFLFLAAGCAILSFYPLRNLPRFLGGRRVRPHRPNLLYFGDIASLEIPEFKELVCRRYVPSEDHVAAEHYFDDLFVQIAVNSKIVERKLDFFALGLLLMGVAFVGPIAYAILLVGVAWL